MHRYALILLLTIAACGDSNSLEVRKGAVNAVAGDRSWHELRPGEPLGDEQTRITVHLQWVEHELREVATPQLSEKQRTNRAAMLDVLEQYRAGGEFPEHSASLFDGRRPRWVDDDGTHCAVAYLVEASGRPELVKTVQEQHEYAYVPAIDVGELAEWAEEYGFTSRELAMIQPTYDNGGVYFPSKREQERRAQEQRKKDAKPRPLKQEHVKQIVTNFPQHTVQATCLPDRTGRWQVKSTVSYKGNMTPIVKVEAKVLETDAVDEALSRCLRKQLRKTAKNFEHWVNYTNKRKLIETFETAIHAPTASEIEQGVLTRTEPWHGPGTRQSQQAACMSGIPEAQLPYRIPLVVKSWNGEVNFRWPKLEDRRRDNEMERKRLYCLQSILNYGRVDVYGMKDHAFDIEVLADGTLRKAATRRPTDAGSE